MELFEVQEERLRTVSGRDVFGKKAIIRIDTGDVLGVVSDKYKLVKHQEVLNSMNPVIKELGVEQPSVNFCKRGAVMFQKFFIPQLLWEPKVGDVVKFGLQVFNSYDGSLPVGVLLIAERLKCTNGLTAPETMTSFSVKHYGSLDLGEVSRKANDVLAKVSLVKSKWEGYRDEKVTEEKVIKFLTKVYGVRLREKLYTKYLAEREGDTVWDLYQTLTYYSTHVLKSRKGNEENIPLLRLGMANGVASGLNNFNWRDN